MMTEKARKAQREYARKWRKKNREHVRSYHKKWREQKLKEDPDYFNRLNRRYWERKAEQIAKEVEELEHTSKNF